MTGPRTMRLGFYMYAPGLGGAERYLRDLLVALDSEDVGVTLLHLAWPEFEHFMRSGHSATLESAPAVELGAAGSTRDAPDDRPVEAAYGATVGATPLRRLSNALPGGRAAAPAVRGALRSVYVARNRRRLRAPLARLDLDVLHVVNGGYPGATSAQGAMLAAADVGIPRRVMTVCSTAAPRRFPTRAERRIDRLVDAACHATVLPGIVPADAMAERRDFRRESMRLIPWGVLPPAMPPERRAARRALGLADDDVVVGTLANFTGAKGHEALLDAFLALRSERPRLRLVLAGSGPTRAATADRAARISGRDVLLPGRVEDPFTLAAALDVFVLASDIEGLPYVILEAMSQGSAIVATDVGAMAEAVVDGVTGILVPRRDVAALTSALRSLVDDPSRRAHLGAAARELFGRRFHVDRMLAAHLALYRAQEA